MKWEGHSKKFYLEERRIFKRSFSLYASKVQAHRIAELLRSAYDLNVIIEFTRRNTCPKFRWSKVKGERIILPLPQGWIPLGAILHEFAHALEYKKFRKTKHRARLMKFTEKLNVHAASLDWFGLKSQPVAQLEITTKASVSEQMIELLKGDNNEKRQ